MFVNDKIINEVGRRTFPCLFCQKNATTVTTNRTTSKQASTTICIVLKATAGDVALGQGLLHDDDQNCGDSGVTDE